MSRTIEECIQAAVILIIAVTAAALTRRLLNILAARFHHTELDLRDDLLEALRLPAAILILLTGIYFALSQLTGLSHYIVKYANVFQTAGGLIILLALTSVINLVSLWYSRKTGADAYQSHLSLIKKLAILTVWVLGSIQLLSMLGVRVTTVMASLGIAGLAAGLALQDTIANLFAGFYMVADRSIRADDYIKLESGEEGFVEFVGWRNTRIRLWSNNVVLIPNSKLTQSIIVNMALPNSVLSVYTWCGVSYDSDLEHVEAVTLEVARSVLRKYPGGDMSYEPVVRFKEFTESNIKLVVVFRAVDVTKQYLLQHEFIKALHKRYKEENIDISSPVHKFTMDHETVSSIDSTTPFVIAAKKGPQ